MLLTWKPLAAVSVCCAAGTFAGLWTWQEFAAYRAGQAKAEAIARAETERRMPLGRQREVVRQWLNDPDSAVFRNEAASKRDPRVWCGEVNARNRMGAMVGHRRYVVELVSLEAPEHDKMARAYVDPDGRPQDGDQVAFDGKYSVYCE